MIRAQMYANINEFQRRDAKEVLAEFANKFKWRNDGTDDLLDVGCGPGNITFDTILPMMPKNFRRLVGGDIADGMIEYSKKHYQHSKLEFIKMDITNEDDVAPYKIDQFDHITSFFVINWTKNQRKSFENIYDILKPGGDCLFILLRDLYIFDVYDELERTEKWGPFMRDWKNLVTSYRFNENILSDVEKYALEAGFKDFTLRSVNTEWIFKGAHKLREFLQSVNPFLDRLPSDEERTTFINCFLKKLITPETAELDEHEQLFVCPYKTIITYGVK